MTPPAAQRVALVLALLVAAAGAGYGLWSAAQSAEQAAARQRGQLLYSGQAALSARLVGHETPLPATAWGCANCHDEGARSAVAGNSARFASVLDRSNLTTLRVRRGGPATAYDDQALCTLLRTGVDPAQVLINTTMPRYAATAAQCRDLWAFLNSR